jgi:hypothetical protein
MPGMDATGPQGQGPLTGWGQGRCQGDVTQPPFVYSGRGRGRYQARGGSQGRFFGRGRRKDFGSRSRGLRWRGSSAGRFHINTAPPIETSTTELELLKQGAEATAQHLERLKTRIAELESMLEASPQASSTVAEST